MKNTLEQIEHNPVGTNGFGFVEFVDGADLVDSFLFLSMVSRNIPRILVDN